jgi:hypothetical protein
MATIKRRPQVGDAVVSLSSGKRYIVEDIHRNGISTRIAFYGVVAVDNPSWPNAFKPGEVAVLDRSGQNAAHADYVAHGGVPADA